MTRRPVIALLAAGDRFEDFHDKIGVPLEAFRTRLTGGWLFNYVEALDAAGVDTVMCFSSERIREPDRFAHEPTGATVWMLPTPRAYRLARRAKQRFAPASANLAALTSYLATPVLSLTRVLRIERCNAILVQEYEHSRFDLLVALGAWLRLPVFATYQGANETATSLERCVRGLMVRRADGVIAGAGAEAERIRTRYRLRPGAVAEIPNPVDVSWRPVDRRRARTEAGLPLGPRIVGWHGRVQIFRKGLDVLLEAWDRVCYERPGEDLLLLLVGSGTDAGTLHQRVDGNPRIRWIDRYVLDRRELWRYLCACDVHVLPSRHEGFAVAPLEAMAAGLPVVGTDVSGVREALTAPDVVGLIVPMEDPDALAEALGRLLDDEDLARRLGRSGRRRAEESFSLELVGRRLRTFLLDGRR